MVAASTWRPRQPSFEGTNATDQTSTAPAAQTPGPAREMVRQPFFLRGRRLAGCHLPSSPTSQRCRDQPRFLLLRLRPELSSVRHTPQLPRSSLRCTISQINTMQWRSPISTVLTVVLPNPRWTRATSHHSEVPHLLQLPPPVPARHQASRLSYSGLHEPSSCDQEM